jgi:thiol-disulfide isomerase/thioredoxin
MTITPSKMIPLGTKAPSFSLRDAISGKLFTLDQLKSDKATVIMFMCNHCPFVKHIRHELINVANHYISEGISFIAINSNDADAYPEDSLQNMTTIANKLKFPFPYLYDSTQEVARAYDAECTPDFFVFDRALACVYRGQFDSARPSNHIVVTGKDLKEALECILKGAPVSKKHLPSLGCNIKWKE